MNKSGKSIIFKTVVNKGGLNRVVLLYVFGHGGYYELPTIRRLRQRLYHAVFNVYEDIDCDGITVNITDRLTGGWLYSEYRWNFSKVGGGFGRTRSWLGDRITKPH